MKGDPRRTLGKFQPAEQGLVRRLAGALFAAADAVDQDVGGSGRLRLREPDFQAGIERDAAVFDRHRADREQRIALRVEPAGFGVDHAPAHVGQRLFEIDGVPGSAARRASAGGIQGGQRAFGKRPDHSW
jgi:hypothetical protein